MSGADHLHQECKVLPIQEHSQLLCKQYLAGTFLPAHPGNKNLQNYNPMRNKKPTVRKFKEEVSAKFQSDLTYKETLKCLHTESVKNAIDKYDKNRVLDAKPPEINPEEQTLSRRVRVELSRLRSGFSRKLNYYHSRIDQKVQDRCPLCEETPHDTKHLFNCKENPTNLTIINLWTKPKEVALFLKLDEEDET